MTVNFIQRQFGVRFNVIKIVRIKRQVVSGMNYLIEVQVKYPTTVVRYSITVYQNIKGEFQITKQ